MDFAPNCFRSIRSWPSTSRVAPKSPDRDCGPVRGPSRPGQVFDLVVAEVIEGLDESGAGGEGVADQDTGGVSGVFELRDVTVGGWPIVHQVDDDVAGEQRQGKLPEAVQRHRKEDQASPPGECQQRCSPTQRVRPCS